MATVYLSFTLMLMIGLQIEHYQNVFNRDLIWFPVPAEAMQAAGFIQKDQPGIWESQHEGVTVDLLVPETLGGRPGKGSHLRENLTSKSKLILFGILTLITSCL